MDHTRAACLRGNRIVAFLILVLLAAMHALPSTAYAHDERKTVRVGWYDSTYCYFDSLGRRCGIAYEYQQKIAAYTGWNYEYVESSWPELLQMLAEGKIDLLSDVSYTEEREEQMLFSAFAMGSESYYIYVDTSNKSITSEDLSTFNGKRIGVNKGSIQEKFLREWAEKNNITPEIVPMRQSVESSIRLLALGKIDAYTTLDSYGAKQSCIPVYKVGTSDFHFAVSKSRPDLLSELNAAMSSIFDEDAFYNQKLFEKYGQVSGTNAFLSPGIEQWLATHGSVRVGYQDNYLPFCTFDASSGELVGALNDYLVHAPSCLRNGDISFESSPYTSLEDAIADLKSEKVDCVFPVNLGLADSEDMDVLVTNSVVSTEVYALMRSDSSASITSGQEMTVALNKKSSNYEEYLRDNFPDWDRVYYPNIEKCLSAVASRKSDCVLVDSYRLNELEGLREKYGLSLVPTGDTMPLAFAVRRSDHELYSVLNKVINLTTDDDVSTYLAAYANPRDKISVMQFLKEHWLGVIATITVVFCAVFFLLLQKLKAERKVAEQQKQIASTREMAYKDALTGVKSKHAYVDAERQMDQRIAEGTVSEFSVGVFDLNDLKKVNDTQGHDAGDQYIREACSLICDCFKRSPVYRIGGDEFAVILEAEDYATQDDLLLRFDQHMDENRAQGKIVISSGLARFDPKSDNSFRGVFERADQRMYARKKALKQAGSSDVR